MAFGKEFGNMAQGDARTGKKGTNSIFVMTHQEIANIPKNRVITYARVVVDFWPQKEDPHHVRITAGGNLIKYAGELTTRTANLTTAKILWNSIISTEDARFMGIDIKSFYLESLLDQYEYMRFPIDIFPEHTKNQYNLEQHALNGHVYIKIQKAIYSLPQAGILANKLLQEWLAPKGYYEVAHTPKLRCHTTQPIQFSLLVDSFGVKYVGQEHAKYLISVLKKHYKLAEDWDGGLYCGIKLEWNYQQKYLDISMPKYVPRVLQRYKHTAPSKPQHSPYQCAPKWYGKDAQLPLPIDDSPKLNKKGITQIQQIVSAILYYAHCVNITLLMMLSTIAHEQTKATKTMNLSVNQMLDYCAIHPNAKICFHTSDMVLNIHSDASYLNAPEARSHIGGHYFLGWILHDNIPTKLNGTIHVISTILKFIATSAAEAELGALFVNAKEGRVIRLILQELGHPQPPTLIHCNNSTTTGIANNTVKRQ